VRFSFPAVSAGAGRSRSAPPAFPPKRREISHLFSRFERSAGSFSPASLGLVVIPPALTQEGSPAPTPSVGDGGEGPTFAFLPVASGAARSAQEGLPGRRLVEPGRSVEESLFIPGGVNVAPGPSARQTFGGKVPVRFERNERLRRLGGRAGLQPRHKVQARSAVPMRCLIRSKYSRLSGWPAFFPPCLSVFICGCLNVPSLMPVV